MVPILSQKKKPLPEEKRISIQCSDYDTGEDILKKLKDEKVDIEREKDNLLKRIKEDYELKEKEELDDRTYKDLMSDLEKKGWECVYEHVEAEYQKSKRRWRSNNGTKYNLEDMMKNKDLEPEMKRLSVWKGLLLES